MLNPQQFRELIIRPVLMLGDLWTPASEVLLLGTALVESNLTYLKQLGGGPALGVYQMEPNTHEDIWNNYLAYHPGYYDLACSYTGSGRPTANELVGNLFYATLMARFHYRRVKAPLPSEYDLPGMAQYWKQYYNTPLGAGTPAKFLEAWRNA